MAERWIVRVFDGSAAAHTGTYSDRGRAQTRAEAIAARAQRRGMNVAVTVRRLEPSGLRLNELLDRLEERGDYVAFSFGGRRSNGGSLDEAVAP